MAAALAWSVDTSIVYICFGTAVFFCFWAFIRVPRGKIFRSLLNQAAISRAERPLPSQIFLQMFFSSHTLGQGPGLKLLQDIQLLRIIVGSSVS